MQHHSERIDILAAKYFAGEATPAEIGELDAWRAASEANQHEFETLEQLWQVTGSGQHIAQPLLNTEAALAQVKGRLKERRSRPGPVLGFVRQYGWQAAAAVVAIVAAAIFFLRTGAATQPQVVLAAATILTDTLSDGSVVTLNRQSGISTTRQFNRKERRLRLQGEAYFEVAPNREKPFVVEVQEVEIIVVGTAFNVDNSTDSAYVTVTVTHGIVRVVDKRGAAMMLTAGEAAVWERATGQITKRQGPQGPNTLAYKDRVFMFDAAPLADVLRQINNVYNANIKLKTKAQKDCKLTARYNNLPLDRVVELIAASFSFQVVRLTDGTIVLDGKGCDE